MSLKVGLLVNPYAGSGARTGEKGSDAKRVLNPELPSRMARFLRFAPTSLHYFTPRLNMGENYLKGFRLTVLSVGGIETTSRDTKAAVKEMLNEGVSLIVFAGGDGTARDVWEEIEEMNADIPILGIPTGVKMHSGVFAQTPEAAGRLLSLFEKGKTREEITDILDVDELLYRNGVYKVKRYFKALTIRAEDLSVPPKSESPTEDVKGIVDYVIENMKDDLYYVFGTGRTVKEIERSLGYDTKPLGVDLFLGKRMVKANVSYDYLVNVTNGNKIVIVVTPIGGQGFLFGRGNQEIGPEVIRRALPSGVICVSSYQKVIGLPCLRVDSGDPELDRSFRSMKVLVGYNEYFSMRICEGKTALE